MTKTIKTFLATWKPAGGVICVVLVKEEDGWRAYRCTDPDASVRDILEAAAARTTLEPPFKEVKEVAGAGQQQLRSWRPNEGALGSARPELPGPGLLKLPDSCQCLVRLLLGRPQAILTADERGNALHGHLVGPAHLSESYPLHHRTVFLLLG